MLLTVLAVGLFLVLRERGVLPPLGPDEPEVPEFSFVVRQTRALPLEQKPRKRIRRKAVEQVRGVMDRLYVAGFLDPGQWEGGSFRAVLREFARPAARQARRDLGDLTLGETAAQLELVTPDRGVLGVNLLYGRGGNPVMAVAMTRFFATGQLAAGAQQVAIEHRGHYILRRVRGRWAIVGYQVRGRIAERPMAAVGGTPSPTGTGASEGGTP